MRSGTWDASRRERGGPQPKVEEGPEQKEARRYIWVVLLVGLIGFLIAVGGCAGGGINQADTPTTTEQTAEQAQQLPDETTAGGESTLAGAGTTGATAETGTIIGVVTGEETGEPLPDTYITVGWKTFKYAAITDENGRYTVNNVPAGVPAPTFGFHDDGYRYHNSKSDRPIKS